MNILILTPDRVGSTLLQRLITVYANIADPDDPTVNLHELTNGLVLYHNEVYNKEFLGKKEKHWGYHQSLNEIVNLIQEAPHGITSRLAYYHIKNRKDSLSDQLSFYDFLNENFYIISARRRNLFEHALSWGISVESKRLNVYSFDEKYEVFKNINKFGINIDPDTIVKYLNQYNEYLDWVDAHFKVNAYFDYEDDIPNLENYILSLQPFKNLTLQKKWQDAFDISWDDWNRMHYLLSLVKFEYQYTSDELDFMKKYINLYSQCRVKIQDLQDAGIMVSGIPIKLHTLQEKINSVKNIESCVSTYNQWIGVNTPTYAIPYTFENLTYLTYKENSQWFFGNVDTSRLISYNNDISLDNLNQSDLKF